MQIEGSLETSEDVLEESSEAASIHQPIPQVCDIFTFHIDLNFLFAHCFVFYHEGLICVFSVS